MNKPIDSPLLLEGGEALEAVLLGLDEARDGMSVTDASGVIRFVNQAAARMLGRPVVGIVERHAWEIDANLTPERFHANWAELETHGEIVRLMSGRDPQGARRHVEGRIRLVRTTKATYVVSFMRDVTEAREAAETLRKERALADMEHTFRAALLRNMGDGVIVTDTEMRITDYSGAAEALYGWTREEAMGRSVSTDFETEYPEGDRALHMGRMQRGESTRAYIRGKRKDGAWVDLDLRIDVIRDAAGTVTHYLLVARDITALKATERELREALQNVKTLSGLLPICSWCKKVRDDDGYWHSLERWIASHSDAQLSHAMCPECAKHWAE